MFIWHFAAKKKKINKKARCETVVSEPLQGECSTATSKCPLAEDQKKKKKKKKKMAEEDIEKKAMEGHSLFITGQSLWHRQNHFVGITTLLTFTTRRLKHITTIYMYMCQSGKVLNRPMKTS